MQCNVKRLYKRGAEVTLIQWKKIEENNWPPTYKYNLLELVLKEFLIFIEPMLDCYIGATQVCRHVMIWVQAMVLAG